MSPDRKVDSSRRTFLLAGGAAFGAWIASHRQALAAAHAHVQAIAAIAGTAPAGAMPDFEFLDAAGAADVEAIADMIVPGGALPGAREAHVVRFVDRALASFFSGWGDEFRLGLSEFQAGFRLTGSAAGSFAAAGADDRIAYLSAHDRSRFFEDVRLLTVLGMFTSPTYGGNFAGAGFRLLGFEDQHAFVPPFGHYDRDYAGFAPYPPDSA